LNKILGIILTITLLISCKNSEKTETENSSDSGIELTQTELIKTASNQTELIAQKILDLPKLQWIYHPEIKERLPVKVLESELIDKSLNLNKFGQKVRILSLEELKKEKIKDYIIFEKLEIKTDTTDFKLHYEIEGAGSSGKFVIENEKWIIFDYSVWEK